MGKNETTAAVTLLADLIQLSLEAAIRYNALRKAAEAEGRRVDMNDVRKLQLELKDNQRRLDAKIDAMPEDGRDDD